jgi:hypothetical protein
MKTPHLFGATRIYVQRLTQGLRRRPYQGQLSLHAGMNFTALKIRENSLYKSGECQ